MVKLEVAAYYAKKGVNPFHPRTETKEGDLMEVPVDIDTLEGFSYEDIQDFAEQNAPRGYELTSVSGLRDIPGLEVPDDYVD